MEMGTTATGKKAKREANVLIELRCEDPISEEVLDANSDDVLDAVEAHAGDIALGPAIALNVRNRAIKLRFDVLAQTDAQIYKQIAKVVTTIEKHTDVVITASQSSVAAYSEPDTKSDAGLVAC